MRNVYTKAPTENPSAQCCFIYRLKLFKCILYGKKKPAAALSSSRDEQIFFRNSRRLTFIIGSNFYCKNIINGHTLVCIKKSCLTIDIRSPVPIFSYSSFNPAFGFYRLYFLDLIVLNGNFYFYAIGITIVFVAVFALNSLCVIAASRKTYYAESRYSTNCQADKSLFDPFHNLNFSFHRNAV